MTDQHPTPPRWARAALRALLPDDVAGDAIAGDLHEEFVHDAARLGATRAGLLYRRRAAGVAARAVVDELCLRSWANGVPVPPHAPVAPVRSRAHVRLGADLGVGAIALALLAIGIVANTLLFSSTHGSRGTHAAGVGGTALAIVCTGAAAIVLCTGPRWLRRRARRRLQRRAA